MFESRRIGLFPLMFAGLALLFGVGLVGVVRFFGESFFLSGLFRCYGLCFSTESLILAQDERWRRA